MVKNGELGPNETPEDDRHRSLLPGKMKGSWGAGEAKGLGKVKDMG